MEYEYVKMGAIDIKRGRSKWDYRSSSVTCVYINEVRAIIGRKTQGVEQTRLSICLGDGLALEPVAQSVLLNACPHGRQQVRQVAVQTDLSETVRREYRDPIEKRYIIYCLQYGSNM